MCFAPQHPTFQVLGAQRVSDPDLQRSNVNPVLFMIGVWQRLELLFSEFDDDDTGVIGRHQFCALVRVLGMGQGPEGERYANDIFDELDPNNSGELSFDEFLTTFEVWYDMAW